uniref:Macaca fascicularis brain cDNA, clone: QtrA-16682 n=1 Tax=Macaca fascicularis TaxID=9541 RepID=I7GKP8_MACFA|nr:unnamed protein product [Macaca fascicularis]
MVLSNKKEFCINDFFIFSSFKQPALLPNTNRGPYL